MKRILYLFLFILIGIHAGSQEVLTGLQFNPVVKAKALELNLVKDHLSGSDTVPITLPFFDDFSADGVFPSSSRWIDRYAFENTDYAVFPINIGVVTMDAINDSGSMYPQAVPGPSPFRADHLTSRYIRLDSVFSPVQRALTPADSVYLSFYYQPQGKGLPPLSGDSLILQFLIEPAHDTITPTDTIHIPDRWKFIWGSRGMALDTFYIMNNRFFNRVMIPVKDSIFFKKNFRFRFYNYVSLASSGQPSWQGNCCQWNIDNIYLNRGRSMDDTVQKEIRFIQRAPSFLKNYESMPFVQYCDDPTNEMIDSIYMMISNRDTINHNSSYNYYVTQEGGAFNQSYNGGEYIIKPFYKYGYVTYQPFAHPPVPFIFPISSSDSAVFKNMHVIKDLVPGSALGDTILGYQRFYNYYAYDDGTPEAGYGLKGTDAKLAYRFRLNKSPDTLRAVRIFFNQTLSQANKQWFYLTVWNDNNGKPGDTIYSRLHYVWYSDSLNQMLTYRLYTPVRISGTFYVGTIQTTDDNLNIGFDRYNNAQSNILYNTVGQWTGSSYTGSLLIRPVIGKPLPLGIQTPSRPPGRISIYPNPCSSDRVTIADSEEGNTLKETAEITVRNLVGKSIFTIPYTQIIDVSGLPNGIYIVSLNNIHGSVICTGKLVIAR